MIDNLFDVLYVAKTGKIKPDASLTDNLFGKKFYDSHSAEEKTVDFTPIITVSDALAKNALAFSAKIVPVQSGSGDPSPQNIRPISGWTGANISVNGSTVAISWLSEAGTVYGGVLDVTTGTLTVTHTISTIDENMSGGIASIGGVWFADGVNNSNVLNGYCGLTACNAYKLNRGVGNTSYAKNVLALYEFCGCTLIGNKTRVFFRDERFTSNTELREWLAENPVYIVYQLAEPITYTLTPTDIPLLLGNNTIWTDTGDSALTYLAKKA